MEVHELSERRACKLAELDRSTFQYEKQAGDDAVMRERLRALAATRRRFGYRRLGILLDREGLGANHKKVFRIYQEAFQRFNLGLASAQAIVLFLITLVLAAVQFRLLGQNVEY